MKLVCLLCMFAIDRPSLEANFEFVSLNRNLLNAFFKKIQLITLYYRARYWFKKGSTVHLQISLFPGGHLVGICLFCVYNIHVLYRHLILSHTELEINCSTLEINRAVTYVALRM